MGSHPTLDQQQLAAEALELDPDDWFHGQVVAHLATDHPQVRAWPDGNPDLAHHLDHRDWTYDHTHPSRERAAEQAFDRLNPEFGVPPTAPTPSVTAISSSARSPSPLEFASPSTTAARTTPTPSSGSPARTTAPPTPSTPPAASPPSPVGVQSGSAPNANHQQHEGAESMAADNHTTIVGNLVEDPEVRFANTGIAVTNLRVAVTQRVQQDGQWRDGDTSFFKVNVWRGQAENLADSLSKGDRVMVTGRLRQRRWETLEGDKRSVTELEADEVGASLKWATVKVERASQRGNGDRAQGRERAAERGGDFNDPPPF
jgi:single-strand DNA-binding protein